MLEIKNVSKSYGGKELLSDVSLCFDEKGIYGVLGGKNAGKSALARLICGCEDASGGEILVDGKPMSRKALALKKKVRLVPTTLTLEDTATALDYLDFVGDAMGVEANKRYRQIKEALELCALDACQSYPFSALTRTQRTRLSVAAALIGNPDVIVLDAPAGGIEGAELSEVLSLLGRIKTVVLFSHKPAEVKGLCKSVAILRGGKVVVSGSVEDIERRLNAEGQTYITVRGDKQAVLEAVASVPAVIDVKVDKAQSNNVFVYRVDHTDDACIKDNIYEALAKIGAPMLSIRAVRLTLEDAFYTLTSDGKDEKGGSAK